MKKLLLFSILAFITLLPSSVDAQLDQRCWTATDCNKTRLDLSGGNTSQAAGGFVVNGETEQVCGATDAEGDKIGFCLPAGKTVTEIAFGGRNEFLHLGDFIQYGYRYAIIVAGILATIMIIISGFQWATSAGGDGINAAKQRISGAVIGLGLAVGSYFLLNLVNPYLVSLRLPQVWLVKSQDTLPITCNLVQAGMKLAKARGQEETIGTEERDARFKLAQQNNQFTVTSSTAACKSYYFAEKSGAQTCRGTFCEQSGGRKHVCGATLDNPDLAECFEGDFTGVIFNGNATSLSLADASFGTATEEWQWPWVNENETELTGVCNNNKIFDIPAEDRTSNYGNGIGAWQQFIIILDDSNIGRTIQQQCGSIENFKGLALIFEMNERLDPTDEDHYVGARGRDLGDEDTFEKNIRTYTKNDLISLEEFQRGGPLSINAGNITDRD